MKNIYDNIDKVLLEKEIVPKEEIERANKETQKKGTTIYESLRDLGIISEKKMASVMAEELDVPMIDISNYMIDKDLLRQIPENFATKYKCLPLFKIENSLTVAMANPQDIEAIDKIKAKTNCKEIDPAIAVPDDIKKTIGKHYGSTEEVEKVIDSIAEGKTTSTEIEERDLLELAEEAPIIKLVNLIISRAVESQASDIHIEPDEKVLRVRYRIDGVLHEVNKPPKYLQGAVISRIKVLAGMDIAKKHAPQDGRINLKIKGKKLDLRISTFPTINGENVVMRLLDKSSVLKGLSKLGFSKENLNNFNSLINQPHGIILVTGPTGSGKTTTLYSALSTINSLDKNIITLEDPVEYRLPLIRQTQINPKAGIDFANGLRSILRQDPDIIMVGEIRDKETAEIAIQAALTGHLVFSTLHTNDTVGALSRLMDMGIEPFLISSSVIGILAQRLVRLLCSNCKTKIDIPKEKLTKLKLNKKTKLYRGKGCTKCRNTGYTGRMAIFELLKIDDEIRNLIEIKASTKKIQKIAIEKNGMHTLMQSGIAKAANGVTSLEEVFRVTQE